MSTPALHRVAVADLVGGALMGSAGAVILVWGVLGDGDAWMLGLVHGGTLALFAALLSWLGLWIRREAMAPTRRVRRLLGAAGGVALLTALPGLPVALALAFYGPRIIRDLPRLDELHRVAVVTLAPCAVVGLALTACNAWLAIRWRPDE